MSTLFCCEAVRPFKPKRLSHEEKFIAFMNWGGFPKAASVDPETENLSELRPRYAVQFVRQVNYGPLESKRYFIPVDRSDNNFIEVSENALIKANFQKLNSFKNFRCEIHNKFFEVNIYQRDPINQHHWRADLAHPAGSIDL